MSLRPPERLILSSLMALALPMVMAAGWLYYPYCENGPTICMWRRLLDVNCPGCGLTRAFCFLAHGRLGEAAGFNLMVIPRFHCSGLRVRLGMLSAAQGIAKKVRPRLTTPKPRYALRRYSFADGFAMKSHS